MNSVLSVGIPRKILNTLPLQSMPWHFKHKIVSQKSAKFHFNDLSSRYHRTLNSIEKKKNKSISLSKIISEGTTPMKITSRGSRSGYMKTSITGITTTSRIASSNTTISNTKHHIHTSGPKLKKDLTKLYYTDIVPWSDNKNEATAVTHEFLTSMNKILLQFVDKTNDRAEKVVDFHQPEKLLQLLDLGISDEPKSLDNILKDCHATLKYQIKPGHPHFFNQLSQGLDTISLAGEWLTATANTNMFTYEVAPVFSLIEDSVLRKMREHIGGAFVNGDSILAPGGTISNLYAVLVARHKKFPDYKKSGLKSLQKDLVVLTSEHCHYSIKSASMVTGMGTNNCISIKADEKGKMIPSELERNIEESKRKGKQPFFVNCTCGTTVYGAFDPIHAIADICQKHDLWLHIDAAWGGGLILSKKYRNPRFNGIERADSVTWNPHKYLSSSLQCSTIHLKEQGLLESCNSMGAAYLFQQDKGYDVKYDTGDKTIQCGRHNDIFKFWLQWRAKGNSGMEKHANSSMELNEYLMEKLRQSPDKFHIIVDKPEFVNTCFWYVPKRLRKIKHDRNREIELGKVCPIIKHRLMSEGTLMVSYQPQGDTPNFFRNVISNPAARKIDIDFLLDELDRAGKDL